MAKFESLEFNHEIQGPYVMFTTTVKIQLDPNEMGKKWRIEIVIVEKDRLTPDDVFQDDNWARSFVANKETISVELNTPIPKRDLNTEPGKEEVYAKLKIVSPDGSSTIAEATTDTVKIDL